MKKIMLLILMVFVISSVSAGVVFSQDQENEKLIVGYAENADKDKVKKDVGASVDSEHPDINAEALSVSKSKKKILENDPNVKYVEEDVVYTSNFVPSDPLARPKDSAEQANLLAVNAYSAWENSKGVGTKIAVLDSGCDTTTDDYNTKVVAQYDFVDDDPTSVVEPDDPIAEDNIGHGTATSAVIGAKTNNSKKIASTGFNTEILCAKVISDQDTAFVSDILQAFDWAKANGAVGINMSFGGGSYSQAFQDKINSAYNQIVPVASAGNTDQFETVHYPAAYTNVEAVSGTVENGSSIWTDSPGYPQPNLGTSYGPYVDVAAPAINVISLCAPSSPFSCAGSWGNFYGTSFAAPHVSGLVALYKAKYPTATPAQFSADLHTYAEDKGPVGRDDQWGYGLVDFKGTITRS